MKAIAHIKTDFNEKFGIPRQSGLVKEAQGKIIFENEYRLPDAFKGIEDFNYIWLIWEFSKAKRDNFSATVKPPRLGGNERMGVFATRSPFRPNNIGLSSVKLDKFEIDEKDGPVLYVSGVDLLDGTPIFDIKPYIPYADCHLDASAGFTSIEKKRLNVRFDDELLKLLPENKRDAVIGILKEDPRPGYQNDSSRRYGVSYAGYDIRFYVDGDDLNVV
nr:tRNA (N6-threonylcarbamoyladenosine(37)-N6)-methyltransferase TrmO [Lachnospiraceae bacterium]